MNPLIARLRGGSLSARVLRSSMLTVGGFGFSQVLRLASNLLLTRLLFPEAFGMMALVMIFIQAVYQFSDLGVTPAIMQSKRGDDPEYLNTAWTIQVIRGFGLWAVASALAWPMSLFYGEPQLMHLLPVAALSLVISGFDPTKIDTANRHLLLGRVTALDMVTQVTGITSAVVLAWLTGSVWALVFSNLISAVVQVVINTLFLPGPNNRFRWEKDAARELINFGKWIFVSTIAGFLFQQGDKILLGKYLTLDNFGVYSIGFFLASFPLLLGNMVTGKILIPIYREAPPKDSPENFAKLRRMRVIVTAGLLAMLCGFSLLGVWLVGVMYDDRYAAAGPMVVLIAVMQMPQVIVLTYDMAALAMGDSKRFFMLAGTRAVLTLATLLIGLELAGVIGGIVARGVSTLLAYPVVVWLSRRTGAWDMWHDVGFALLAVGLGAGALAFHWDEVATLVGIGM